MVSQAPPERHYVESIEPDKWDDRFHFDELRADDEKLETDLKTNNNE